MDATWIITSFVVIDDMMQQLDHKSHCLSRVSDSEVLTIAVVAARYFNSNHERAVQVMNLTGFLSGSISPSRFNRRIHQLADWFDLVTANLAELFATGESFVVDSLPVPVCKRVRASRCRKVRGRVYCGYCAPKKERFFGWRLHLVCTPEGMPVAFSMLPASLHDLTPIHELCYGLSSTARVYADKGYNSAADEATILTETGVRLIPIRKDNMENHIWLDREDLRRYRHTIETVNSQLESMGIERLHARTNAGFDIKVQASVLAVAFTNFH